MWHLMLRTDDQKYEECVGLQGYLLVTICQDCIDVIIVSYTFFCTCTCTISPLFYNLKLAIFCISEFILILILINTKNSPRWMSSNLWHCIIWWKPYFHFFYPICHRMYFFTRYNCLIELFLLSSKNWQCASKFWLSFLHQFFKIQISFKRKY